MSLKTQLDNDIKTALLGGDRFRGEVLRNLKAAVLNEEVAKGLREEGLGDAAIEQVIAKEVKKRIDSIEQYTAADRPELADNERNEMNVLVEYLPEQLSEEDVKKVVLEVIAELGAAGPQAMGQVIGAVKGKLGTSADGGTIAKLVKEALKS